jgi:hypothetical protein
MTDHPTPERAAPEHRVATPSGADVAFADIPPTGSRRAHHTQIGCSASTAHHAGDPRRIVLVTGRDNRLD